jgi:uncharacterized membrane protein
LNVNFAATVVPFWAFEATPAIITCAGIFIILICRPLIAGKIAPNRFYGMRTPLAFSSEENWYRVNRLGGRIMSRSGVMMVCVGLAGFVLSPLVGLVAYNLIATVLVLVAVIGAAIRILRIR